MNLTGPADPEEEDEEPGRRLKPRRKQHKPFTIEWRWDHILYRTETWSTMRRYATAERRDKALSHFKNQHHTWTDYRKGPNG